MAGDMEMAAHLRGNDSLAQVVTSQQQQRQEITVAQVSPEAINEIMRQTSHFPSRNRINWRSFAVG